MNFVTLRSNDFELLLAPEVGGSIAEFSCFIENRRVDLLRPFDRSLKHFDARDMASFPLLPFCNRIRDGRFSFQGKPIQLTPNLAPSPHAIHGIGWQRPWSVGYVDESRAELALHHCGQFDRDSESAGAWPWSFYASQTFQLSALGLEVTTRLENCSTYDMPCGIGHHPYFPRTKESYLRCHTESQWMSDSEVLPTHLRQSEVVQKLSEGLVLGSLRLDHCFIGWAGTARIESAPTLVLQLKADPPLSMLNIYTPDHPYFCVEPVSMCPDGFNLSEEYPVEQLGVRVLKPGACMQVTWCLEIQGRAGNSYTC